MATEFWSPAKVIFGQFVFSFQISVFASLEYWQSELHKLSNEVSQQIWSKNVSFYSVLTVQKSKMAAMKIQDGALVTSCDITAEVW